MVFAPEWLGVAAGRWLALADYTIAYVAGTLFTVLAAGPART